MVATCHLADIMTPPSYGGENVGGGSQERDFIQNQSLDPWGPGPKHRHPAKLQSCFPDLVTHRDHWDHLVKIQIPRAASRKLWGSVNSMDPSLGYHV